MSVKREYEVTIDLTAPQNRLLQRMVQTGLYGSTLAKVAEELFYRALREEALVIDDIEDAR